MLTLTYYENKFAEQIKTGVSDGNLIKVSRVDNFLCNVGEHCQVCRVDEDNMELSNHEGNRALLWVVLELFLLSFHVIDHIELLLSKVLDLLLIFTSYRVLPGRKLELSKAKLQFMLPSESKRPGILDRLPLIKEQLE